MLDNKNKKIINFLQENGRKSLNEIGKQQNLSHTSIQKRLNKLISSNLVKISAVLNLNELEFSFAVIIAEIEGHDNLTKIIDTFKNCPRILFLSPMMGGHNLISIMACEDASSMNQIINVCSFRNHPAVRRSEVYICDSPIIPQFFNYPIIIEHKEKQSPCGITCLECEKFQNAKCVGCPGTIHYKFNQNKGKSKK